MRAVIVGSGPSAAGFVPPEGAAVIAVNGAVEWLSRADYWFTLDPSEVNRARMGNPRGGVRYCAAVSDETDLPRHVTRFRRVSAERSAGPEPLPGTPSWWFWRWGCVPGLSDDPAAIHSGNSAYGAVGLAYHLGAEKALLVGIDADGSERIEGGRCNNLSHLPMLFASALPQMNMVSCGGLATVPQLRIEDGIEWLLR